MKLLLKVEEFSACRNDVLSRYTCAISPGDETRKLNLTYPIYYENGKSPSCKIHRTLSVVEIPNSTERAA